MVSVPFQIGCQRSGFTLPGSPWKQAARLGAMPQEDAPVLLGWNPPARCFFWPRIGFHPLRLSCKTPELSGYGLPKGPNGLGTATLPTKKPASVVPRMGSTSLQPPWIKRRSNVTGRTMARSSPVIRGMSAGMRMAMEPSCGRISSANKLCGLSTPRLDSGARGSAPPR